METTVFLKIVLACLIIGMFIMSMFIDQSESKIGYLIAVTTTLISTIQILWQGPSPCTMSFFVFAIIITIFMGHESTKDASAMIRSITIIIPSVFAAIVLGLAVFGTTGK